MSLEPRVGFHPLGAAGENVLGVQAAGLGPLVSPFPWRNRRNWRNSGLWGRNRRPWTGDGRRARDPRSHGPL